MSDIYTKRGFAARYVVRGYGSKNEVDKWIKESGRDEFTEVDFEKCYHEIHNRGVIGSEKKCTGKTVDGQDLSAPQKAGNNRDKSFTTLMKKEMDALDRQERKYKHDVHDQ